MYILPLEFHYNCFALQKNQHVFWMKTTMDTSEVLVRKIYYGSVRPEE